MHNRLNRARERTPWDRRPGRRAATAGTRAALGVLALFVAAVAALGTWQVVSARDSQVNVIESGETTAARLASSALGSALASRLLLISNLAGQPGLSTVYTRTSASEQAKLAAELHVVYPGFASFALVSARGRLDARWPEAPGEVGESLASQAFFRAVVRTGRPYISPASQQQEPPGDIVTVLAAPVRDSAHRLVGLLLATLPAASLGQFVGGAQLPARGQVLMFDQFGHAFLGPAASASRSYRSVPALARALSGRTGAMTGDVPGFRGERLIGYSPMPSTGWVVLVEEPASVLSSQVAAMTERVTAIGLIVLIMAIGAAAIVASLLKRLSQERQRAGSVLASVGEGVATFDTDGVMLTCNPALQLLCGQQVGAPAGKRWEQALELYDQKGVAISWESSLAAQAAREGRILATSGYDLHLGRVDGQRLPVSMTAAPLRAGDELLGSAVVLRDISTEREIDQLKSSLVSTVSHELRTPLTMVQGFTELLLARHDLGAARSREALEHIHSAALRLGRLIDDLLSVSRIDAGKLRLDLAAVSVPEVVGEVIALVASNRSGEVATSADWAQRIVNEVPPDLPLVTAEKDKLVQVLLNLVTNALKYSQPPAPVRVTAVRKHDYAEISVIDQGIGLSEPETTTVFEKFSRVDRPEVRKVSGTGLGLYITKNLIEMQHGQVWVNSERDRGSTFSFSMPLAPSARGNGLPFAFQSTKEGAP